MSSVLLGGLRRGLRGRRHDRNIGAPRASGVKLDRTVGSREDRVVAADPDMRAGMKLGAALAHDDVAGDYDLSAELLDAEPPAAAVAPVARRAARFFMRHPSLLPRAEDPRHP